MTATFSLAHLSDIHLAPVPWPRLGDLDAKRALGLANWHRKRKRQHGRDVIDALVADLHLQRPDHIAVGGDLVNIGLPAEIEAARIWLGTVGSPATVSVVPGNHDVYGVLGTDPGIARWRAYMGGEGQFPFLRQFGSIALICLNSAVPTPVFWASGRVGAEQRERLAGLLEQLGRESVCRIVLLHHPPLPGQSGRLRGLDDAQETAEIFSRYGAELVLHGHNHQSTLRWLDGRRGRIPVVGVPSASGRPGFHAPAARYNLFDIRPASGGWRIGMTGRQYRGDGKLLQVERTELGG